MKQLQTALDAGRAVRDKKIGAVELVSECFRSIEENEPTVHAFINFDKDAALERAKSVQADIDSGKLTHPLAGVPFGSKANISTKGYETNCASKILEGYKPVFDATVAEKLNGIGAVCVGKCNMDEFAMGGSTETSRYGVTRNPWDKDRVPGGSSGGSAVSVAAGEAFYALGSDTGGSIRQPCAFCNTTGIKPTYGAVSRYGLIAYASSLDQIGPIARDVADCAAVLDVISGKDPRDMTSAETALNLDKKPSVSGLRIGLPREYFAKGLDGEVAEKVRDAAKLFEKFGAEVSEFDFSEKNMADYTAAAYYVIACAEASSNLSRYDGIKYGYSAFSEKDNTDLLDNYVNSRSEGFGMEVKRRIMLGAFVLSSGFYDAYYKKALRVRDLLREQWAKVFTDYDIVLSPVAPTTAYKIGENLDDPLKMILGDMYTVAVNMAGLPSVALPAGFAKGLPVGMQLIGRHFEENVLISAASEFQKETDYHTQFPIIK
ncbi:glutamyl-tRNA(Gln) amidotransferase subunit A [Clostridia bacterium]|nr:glutamyl-tRNA(Gln) amidotransferase subunit A [Clostridia bacterium]